MKWLRAPGIRDASALRRQAAQVRDRHDRRGAEPAVAGGHVEVELRRPAEAEALVQGNGLGHEAGRVEGEDRSPGLAGEPLAGRDQGAGDAVAARGRVDGERAPAGPARGKADVLDRGVRVERPAPANPAVDLDHDQPAVAGVLFQVEHVGQVGREDVQGEQVGVLAVPGDQDLTDRRIIGWHRVADERHGLRPGRYGGVGYWHDLVSFVSWMVTRSTTRHGLMFTPRAKNWSDHSNSAARAAASRLVATPS